MGWFFSDYRVSSNFLLCWGWVVVEVGLGCDNSLDKSHMLSLKWGPCANGSYGSMDDTALGPGPKYYRRTGLLYIITPPHP